MPQGTALDGWWCVLRKEREFVYAGEPIPKIILSIHTDFLLQIQKAMLLSLAQRKLLSTDQVERVAEELELKTYEKIAKPS